MKKELKQKWIDALRSGKYTQTFGALKRVEEYEGNPVGDCCLGVLCEVMELPYVIVGDGIAEFTFPGTMRDTGSLPYSFMEMIEIDLVDVDRLVGMNDKYGFTFKEIADWIELNIKGD